MKAPASTDGFARAFLFAALLAVAIITARAEAAHPQDFLPPALPWHGASEALVAASNDPWITPAEATGLADTPDYATTIAYLRRLEAASPRLHLLEFGRSAQGRPLYLVIASADKAFDPGTMRSSRKPVLLVQAGIHAGEIDGKDAGLMLLRDIALRGKASLLDQVQFLFVPVFNADGHERVSEWNRANQRGPIHQGWRATAQNRNLNRDYMKADTVEMRAMLRLLNEWSPTLYLDLHVSDESDYQYDITFGFNGDAGVFAWSPEMATWLHQIYRPGVEAALTRAGHKPGPLVFPVDARDPTKGHTSGPYMPRYSTGYGDLRHLPTVLVENHALKPYRQRVLGTYVLLEATLRVLGGEATALKHAIASDSAKRPSRIPFNWGNYNGPVTNRGFAGVQYETYHSEVSGGLEIRWLGKPKDYASLPLRLDRPGVELTRPAAYWVPVTSPNVIDRLRAHGVQMETAEASKSLNVQMYRLTSLELFSSLRDQGIVSTSRSPWFEGRFQMRAKVQPETRLETFPAGSVRVPTDQPLGDLVVALLEPESNDSFLGWGFFPEILQQPEYIEGYVAAPMAERMLAEDPQLKSAFEAKLRADSKFAANPSARLDWFYQRSRFYDERYLLYPVGIEPAEALGSSP